VAIGTLVATSVEAAITLPFGARVLGVRLSDVARRILLPGIVPLIPAVAVLVVLHAALAPTTIPTIALSSLAGAIVYSATYLSLPETASERALARRAIRLAKRALSH
jgi:hypothetical protein